MIIMIWVLLFLPLFIQDSPSITMTKNHSLNLSFYVNNHSLSYLIHLIQSSCSKSTNEEINYQMLYEKLIHNIYFYKIYFSFDMLLNFSLNLPPFSFVFSILLILSLNYLISSLYFSYNLFLYSSFYLSIWSSLLFIFK